MIHNAFSGDAITTGLISPQEGVREEYSETRNGIHRRMFLLLAFDQPDHETTLDRLRGLKNLIECVIAEEAGDPHCAQAQQCLDELLEDWDIDHFDRLVMTLYSETKRDVLLTDITWVMEKLHGSVLAEKALVGIET